MKGVGTHGGRTGPTHDMALERHKRNGHGDREHHHADAHQNVLDRARRKQPAYRFDDQERRRTGDEGRLSETGERLGLAVTETVLAIVLAVIRRNWAVPRPVLRGPGE